MSDRRSPVDAVVVRHVATLARLEVPEAELERLTEQLARIVSYIDQLKEIPEEALGRESLEATPLRSDRAEPGGGLEALEGNLPRQLHGYGVVPRVVESQTE